MHIDPIRATGEAMPTIQPNPLFQLILDYARARDVVNADVIGSDEQLELDMIPVLRITKQLTEDAPPCTTATGAAAVLRLLAADIEETIAGFHAPVLAAVLAYLTYRWEHPEDEIMRQLAS